MATKQQATTERCIYQGCPNEFVPTRKYPGPHCVPCTDAYLAQRFTDRGLRVPATRTTRPGFNYVMSRAQGR